MLTFFSSGLLSIATGIAPQAHSGLTDTWKRQLERNNPLSDDDDYDDFDDDDDDGYGDDDGSQRQQFEMKNPLLDESDHGHRVRAAKLKKDARLTYPTLAVIH